MTMVSTSNAGHESGPSQPRQCPECRVFRPRHSFRSYQHGDGWWAWWCDDCVTFHRDLDAAQIDADYQHDWNAQSERIERHESFGHLLDDGDVSEVSVEWDVQEQECWSTYSTYPEQVREEYGQQTHWEQAEEAGGDSSSGPLKSIHGTDPDECDISADWYLSDGLPALYDLLRPCAVSFARRYGMASAQSTLEGYDDRLHEIAGGLLQEAVLRLLKRHRTGRLIRSDNPANAERQLVSAARRRMIDVLRAERLVYRRRDDTGRVVTMPERMVEARFRRPLPLDAEQEQRLPDRNRDSGTIHPSAIGRAMDAVPDARLLILHHVEDWTWAEIAEQEGRSEAAVRQAGKRARDKLRTILADHA